MSQPGPKAGTGQTAANEDCRQKIEARIRHLERAPGNGLLAMALFLLVSFFAYNGFAILPDLSDETRRMLGAPPPAEMISLALVVYAFSGIVRTLARMSRNIKPYLGLMHAAFFTAFYAFYHLSGALPGNFWAVFFAGISVMGLENYYLWAHSSEAAVRERSLLASMRRGRGGHSGDSGDQGAP